MAEVLVPGHAALQTAPMMDSLYTGLPVSLAETAKLSQWSDLLVVWRFPMSALAPSLLYPSQALPPVNVLHISFSLGICIVEDLN